MKQQVVEMLRRLQLSEADRLYFLNLLHGPAVSRLHDRVQQRKSFGGLHATSVR